MLTLILKVLLRLESLTFSSFFWCQTLHSISYNSLVPRFSNKGVWMATLKSLRVLLEKQSLSLLNQNLHLTRFPMWFAYSSRLRSNSLVKIDFFGQDCGCPRLQRKVSYTLYRIPSFQKTNWTLFFQINKLLCLMFSLLKWKFVLEIDFGRMFVVGYLLIMIPLRYCTRTSQFSIQRNRINWNDV